ncbi:MAG: hypothetical protein BGO70_13035 [Bacteroidetes bacterium 43-93]|nr:sensor histidine kinase [Bacteroidota bacterium]OJW99364.1 MAG: hypothetical protein BGO70_13035 [Bacteroidetes bacterium 43-93]
MSDNQLSFKISTGLKNIIGRDLITDDFVAVFELVKNSFDAYAKNVVITFNQDKITIADDGKGMNLEDIQNKWLFVAYSAKKEGVEDNSTNNTNQDYRDIVQSKKIYAGAKGIGRFSCDRLGSKLVLTTKKKENFSLEQIEVDWNDFEKNSTEAFVDIKVKHRTVVPISRDQKKLEKGTILEITNLNSTWNREKKIALKHSLEKLINPFEENPLNGFSITIVDSSEIVLDKEEKRKRYQVNGPVKNFVFETLGLKTTQILTQIDEIGEYITTTLWDRETLIYKIRKPNNSNPKLKNIKFHLFHLNKAAKNNFKRLMGIESVNFGSVFLYKNGFRIAPYGDVGYDYFGLDSRKSQKHFRRFGSRDLIGRIEIIGDNPDFREISSRDGGLVRNDHYHALVRCFISQCLEKIENYATSVQFTNKADKENEDLSALENIKAKSALLELIVDESSDEESELLEVDKDNLSIRTEEILKEASEKDLQALKSISDKLKNQTLTEEYRTTVDEHQRIQELTKELEKKEREKQEAELERNKLQQELQLEKEKNTYLRSSSKALSEDAKGLVHNIKLTAKEINSNTETLLEKIRSGEFKTNEILRRLEIIKFNAGKALKISKLITRANFKTQADNQIVDIVKYIEQYITLYSDIYEKNQLDFKVITNNSTFLKKVNVLEVSLIIDDLISNSSKAGATQLLVEMTNISEQKLRILFSDDGSGLPDQFIENPEPIFELGITTTDGGSGIGLHSVRKALKGMKATISFIGNGISLKGATFEILFN